MSYPVAVDQNLLKQWRADKFDVKAVEQTLLARGLDPESINIYLKAYQKFCVAQKQFVGFFLMSLGAVLGFVSCVLSLVNPIPSLYEVILYGFTSVAILLIVAGMYCLFE
jgi:hypothetical protein